MYEKISNSAQEIIEQYNSLDFGNGKKVCCPYFRNYKKIGGLKLRSLSGKGTPEEIIDETKINAHLLRFNWRSQSLIELRKFMEKNDIGIDCSGFVMWVLYYWLKSDYRINLFKEFRKKYRIPFAKWIRLIFRPAQNISANMLTSEKVALRINKLNNIKPGDLIRSKKGDHVMLITEVEKDNQDKIKKIIYWHSTNAFDEFSGIQKRTIEIINLQTSLKEQNWLNMPGYSGEDWTSKDFKEVDDGDNGVYRFRGLDNLRNK